MAEKTIEVEVEIVPVQGKPVQKRVSVAKTGASLRDVLAAAGISPEKKDFLVSGKPATLDTHVTGKDIVTGKVQVSERPRGS